MSINIVGNDSDGKKHTFGDIELDLACFVGAKKFNIPIMAK